MDLVGMDVPKREQTTPRETLEREFGMRVDRAHEKKGTPVVARPYVKDLVPLGKAGSLYGGREGRNGEGDFGEGNVVSPVSFLKVGVAHADGIR